MSNKQLKGHFDSTWSSLKGLKASEIEYHIEMSRQLAEPIVGVGEIQKIKNSSLLRLLLYELIIFADESTSLQCSSPSKLLNSSSTNQESVDYPLMCVRDVKQLMENIGRKNRKGMSQLTMDKFQYKALVRKISSLEEELREEALRKNYSASSGIDPEGTEAMIEQLQILLLKKQRRIKELNNQLQYNFEDKDELEIQIQSLEEKNQGLEDAIKDLEKQNRRCKDELQRFKALQKDELLFGASQFMNSQFPHRQNDVTFKQEDSTVNQERGRPGEMLNSTRMLANYCSIPTEKKDVQVQTPQKEEPSERKTVKRSFPTVISEENAPQEQNLLQSMRIYRQRSQVNAVGNNDQSLERMLFIQAAFIERAMESIIN